MIEFLVVFVRHAASIEIRNYILHAALHDVNPLFRPLVIHGQDLVFEQINQAEKEATAIFAGSGIAPTVTGSGRLFSTLDHYIVVSQLSSFGTAFATVFAVIFVVFRSARFGLLAIIANALPVCAVLGIMGWLGISLNVATVMVASVALGIVDDGNPNAFTFGRTPRDARIWISRGLLERLDERELDAVVTHEVGHIKHWDFAVMTLAAVVPMVLYLAYLIARGSDRSEARAVALGGDAGRNQRRSTEEEVASLGGGHVHLWITQPTDAHHALAIHRERGLPRAGARSEAGTYTSLRALERRYCPARRTPARRRDDADLVEPVLVLQEVRVGQPLLHGDGAVGREDLGDVSQAAGCTGHEPLRVRLIHGEQRDDVATLRTIEDHLVGADDAERHLLGDQLVEDRRRLVQARVQRDRILALATRLRGVRVLPVRERAREQ